MGHSLAGQWEFPGGKIEKGESPEEALARELNEELGIEAEVGALKLASTHSYGDTGIVILFYEVHFWKGEPKAVHHMDLRWVEPSELGALPIPDANKKMLPRIRACLA
jgi:8-oxo-dGTP diphosphatase